MDFEAATNYLAALAVMYPPTRRQKTWQVGNIPMAEFVALEKKIRQAMRVVNRAARVAALWRTPSSGFIRSGVYFNRLRVIFNGPRERVFGQHSNPMHTRRAKARSACIYIGSGYVY